MPFCAKLPEIKPLCLCVKSVDIYKAVDSIEGNQQEMKMTYCEEIGLKAGDKIRVLQEGRQFDAGDIITLDEDDGSTAPWFVCEESGERHVFSLPESEFQGYLPEGQGWKRVPKQDDEGWIEWKGGECPVEIGTLVDVKHRDGEICEQVPAGMPAKPRRNDAEFWYWQYCDGDIIAYRLSQSEAKVEETEMKPSLTDQLKQALKQQRKHERKARFHTEKAAECEAKASELIDKLSAEIGVKLRIVEAMADEEVVDTSKLNADIPDGVDVNDPETWQEGDVIVCFNDKYHSGAKSSYFTQGKEYEFNRIDDHDNSVEVKKDDTGNCYGYPAFKFRFVHRPSLG